MDGWIGVDLDGTLAHYDHGHGTFHIGEPVEKMRIRVLEWLAKGARVKIVTARYSVNEPARSFVVTAIQDWTERHGMGRLEVTNAKDFAMIELWDDRAVRVEMNTGVRIR